MATKQARTQVSSKTATSRRLPATARKSVAGKAAKGSGADGSRKSAAPKKTRPPSQVSRVRSPAGGQAQTTARSSANRPAAIRRSSRSAPDALEPDDEADSAIGGTMQVDEPSQMVSAPLE